jgi:hypothetical protein
MVYATAIAYIFKCYTAYDKLFGRPFDGVPGLGFSWAAHSRQPQARGHCTGTPEHEQFHFFRKKKIIFELIL